MRPKRLRIFALSSSPETRASPKYCFHRNLSSVGTSWDDSSCLRDSRASLRYFSQLKLRLRIRRDAEGPHMIGRESNLLRFDWLDLFARFAPILNVNVYGP